MKERISYSQVCKTQPALTDGLISIGKAAFQSGLESALCHLVKIRASQINGCAFCQHLNLGEARKDGESQTRLDLLATWRDLAIFSERERAALAWTEALTTVADGGVNASDFAEVSQYFSEAEVINLTGIIVAINAWNRIAVGFNFMPNVA